MAVGSAPTSNPASNPFSLDERVVLITGSTRGIGRALAQACAEAGAHVVVNARTGADVEEAVADLVAAGLSASGSVADVTDERAVEDMVESVEGQVGPIAGLVNNAGVQIRGPMLDFDPADYRRILELNLVAPFLVGRAVGRRMVDRSAGRIVNIGSVQSQLGRPTIVPYTASKGGVVTLTRGMCADLSPHGVQVNCVAPGYFKTELTSALVDDQEFSDWLSRRTPAGRWGELSELGGAVVFLLSDAASFITGQTLYVDGGMTAVV